MTSDEQELTMDEEVIGGDAEEWQQDAEDGSANEENGQDEEGLLSPETEPGEELAAAEITYRGADGKERTEDIKYEDVVALLESKSKFDAAEARADAAEARVRQIEKELEGYKNDRDFSRGVLNDPFLMPIISAAIHGKKPEDIIAACREHFDQFEETMENQPQEEDVKYKQLASQQEMLMQTIEQDRQAREMERIMQNNNTILISALEELGLTFDEKRDAEILRQASVELGYSRNVELNARQAKNLLRTAAEIGNGKAFTPKQKAKQPSAQPPQQRSVPTPPRVMPAKGGSGGSGKQAPVIANPEQERLRRMSAR